MSVLNWAVSSEREQQGAQGGKERVGALLLTVTANGKRCPLLLKSCPEGSDTCDPTQLICNKQSRPFYLAILKIGIFKNIYILDMMI